MQNSVVDMCEKFHNDRLRNDRALVHWKSDNNKNKPPKHNNNVDSGWEPVSGSKNMLLLSPGQVTISRTHHHRVIVAMYIGGLGSTTVCVGYTLYTLSCPQFHPLGHWSPFCWQCIKISATPFFSITRSYIVTHPSTLFKDCLFGSHAIITIGVLRSTSYFASVTLTQKQRYTVTGQNPMHVHVQTDEPTDVLTRYHRDYWLAAHPQVPHSRIPTLPILRNFFSLDDRECLVQGHPRKRSSKVCV